METVGNNKAFWKTVKKNPVFEYSMSSSGVMFLSQKQDELFGALSLQKEKKGESDSNQVGMFDRLSFRVQMLYPKLIF